MKAEYIALSQSMCDLLPMQYFIMEILTYSTIFEDNNSALVLASSPKMMPRSKHIAIKYHFFREVIWKGIAHIAPIQTEEQLANILTKGLPEQTFSYLWQKLMGW